MTDPHLLRMLELVRRELDASDARIELGGKDPSDVKSLWCRLPGGARLVVTLPEPPDDASAAMERLSLLAKSFSDSASPSADFGALHGELASRRLDDELAMLADRAGAVRAVVIDAQSPVIWGTNEMRRGNEDVDTAVRTVEALDAAERAGVDLAALLLKEPDDARAALQAQGLDADQATALAREVARIRQESRRTLDSWRNHLYASRAIAAVRREHDDKDSVRDIVHGQGFGYIARSFANIYRLVLVFTGKFSELHAEGAVVHALPVIEKLVLALPPVEPPPRGGRVIRLHPQK